MQPLKPKIYEYISKVLPGGGGKLNLHVFFMSDVQLFLYCTSKMTVPESMLNIAQETKDREILLVLLPLLILYSLSTTWPFLQTFCFHKRGNHLNDDYVQCELTLHYSHQ